MCKKELAGIEEKENRMLYCMVFVLVGNYKVSEMLCSARSSISLE